MPVFAAEFSIATAIDRSPEPCGVTFERRRRSRYARWRAAWSCRPDRAACFFLLAARHCLLRDSVAHARVQ